MYGWLKYVAVALIVAVFGKIIYDVIKATKVDGGDWKDILFRVLLSVWRRGCSAVRPGARCSA